MDRRSFLRGSAALPAIIAGAITSPNIGNAQGITRVSCEKGDPGERAYAILSGDGKRAKVLLDGAEQREAITADSVEGFVKRIVRTPEGNFAFNGATGELYTEIVHGRVEILIA